MSKSAERYVSRNASARMRRQAFRVWTVGFVVVVIWVLLILAAAFASGLFNFFSYVCHQIPARSFHIAGEPFGVCSRCCGVYFGLVVGFAAYPIWRNVENTEPPPRVWLFLSLVPIGVDWSLTVFGIWENTQASRLITGLILGFVCATFIVPGIVEIARNLSLRTASY